jgi:hypothetical protein
VALVADDTGFITTDLPAVNLSAPVDLVGGALTSVTFAAVELTSPVDVSTDISIEIHPVVQLRSPVTLFATAIATSSFPAVELNSSVDLEAGLVLTPIHDYIFTVFTGVTENLVILDGVWDGTTIQPLEVDGVWNGSVLIPAT